MLIWAASQIIEARDLALRLRGCSSRHPTRSWASSVGEPAAASISDLRRHRTTPVDDGRDVHSPAVESAVAPLLLINEWKERASIEGRALGLELIVPEWFYATTLDSVAS